MPARSIKFEGKTYQFPDDATEQEISDALASVHDQGTHGDGNVTGDPRMEVPLANARISPPESGIGGSINRGIASVRTALGANKPEHGSGSAAVDPLLGGTAIGPLHVAHGLTKMPRHPVDGFNEVTSGVAQTAALPLAVAAPAAIPMSMPYVAGAKAGAWGLKEAGMDPDNADALSNLVTMGIAGRGPATRGVGRVLEKVGGAADIPELPSVKAGTAARMFNAVKRPIGQMGRKMANYGVPPAPNVFEGDSTGPLPGEPDLPTPVKPDGTSHHNDVTDQGELNKLLDAVEGHRLAEKGGASTSREDGQEHHDDILPKYAAVDGTTTKLTTVPKSTLYHGTAATNVPSILREGLDPAKSDYGLDDEPEGPFTFLGHDPETAQDFAPGGGGYGRPGIKGAILKAQVPENSIRTDLGEFARSPSRIRPDQISVHKYVGPDVHTEIGPGDEPIPLPESPLTKSFSADDVPTPNSDTLLRAIRSAPGWPENGLPDEPWDKLNGPDLDSDPYNRVDEIAASQPKRRASDQPFRRSTDAASSKVGGLSDAADNDDIATAKSTLGPDASASQVLLEAQRLKDARNKGGK